MRRNLLALFRNLTLSTLLLLASTSAFANHIAGMQMYYEWVTGNTYRVYIVAIGDCGSATTLNAATPRVCLFNGATSIRSKMFPAFGTGTEITPVCPSTITTCAGGTIDGYRRFVTSDTFQLTGTSTQWRFLFNGYMGTSSAGRSSALVNISGAGSSIISLCDTLNNAAGSNSSPVLSSPFTPFFCQGNIDNYNPGAVDPNGDALTYSLVSAMVAGTPSVCTSVPGSVTYNAGYSAAAPLGTATSSWTFDPATGQITFVPTTAAKYAVDYNMREFRGATFVGNSSFEVNFIIQTCSAAPPDGDIVSSTGTGTIVDTTHYQICQGSGPFTFDIQGTSPGGFNVEMTASGLPAGSTFTVAGDSTTSPVGTFSWNASTATPGVYTFFVSYKDDQCPVNGTNTQAFTVTIYAQPTAITGTPVMCVGATTTLANTVTGGSWFSSNALIAAADLTTGIITGMSAGTTIISYIAPGGCFTVTPVTVNPVPNAIGGTLSVCVGSTTSLTNSTGGGTWSSSTTSVATIGSSSGAAFGVSAGTSTITYRLTATGCYTTAELTVSALPAAITGPTQVCVTATITQSNITTGGTWSSGTPAVGTIDPTSGVVTGITAGTTRISYSLGTGCFVTRIITVNANPAAITPPAATSICLGGTTTLADATGSGTWSSSNTAVGTVSSGGVVGGVGVGTAMISYIITATGCYAVKPVTVNTAPTAIIPASPQVCVGSTLSLTNAVTGGTWSSSVPAVATIGSSSGVANGVSNGTTVITYAIGTCTVSATLIVNPTPTINPTTPTSLCVGNVTTLTATIPGGTWSSTATGVATVGTSGIVTAIAPGTTTISYILTTGCFATKVITVNSTPAAITPATPTVCEGSTTTLSNSVSGGTWTSGTTSVATIGSGSGVATGVLAGTSIITYAIGTCSVTATLTVNATPPAITPSTPTTLCIGNTVALSNTLPGGVWSSTTPAVATISAGGLVTAVAAGTTTISYTMTSGCYAIKVITVSTSPAAITPASPVVCQSSTITLSNTVAGGTWSTGSTNVTVGSSSGVVTGVTVGTAVVTYAIGTCTVSTTVTINAAASAGTITGPTSLCAGSTITLANATSGGTWTSSNTSVATIGSASGIVTGVAGGTTTISYSVTNSCGTAVATYAVTVNAAPVAGTILGSNTICQGSFTIYTDASPGGVWSTSIGNATITSAGVASGVTVGTDVISYTVTNSCGTATATKAVTINAAPSAGTISGSTTVCTGSSITLSSTVTGGTWVMTNTRATITSSGGVLTGVTAGLDTAIYTVTNSCGSATASYVVDVIPTGSAGTVSGPSTVCVSGSIMLTSTVSGGAWSSSNSNATVGSSSGIVTGIFPGIDTITYTVTGACGLGTTSKIVTINALPVAGTLSGPTSVCVGSVITLSSTVSGGTWSASNTNATIGSSTGVVIGAVAGTVGITYTVTSSCGTATATRILTVNPLPAAGTISGPDSVCTGATITLASTVVGGVWTSGNANATVGSLSGIVTGVTPGTTPITYTYTNMCGSATAVKVVAVVAPPVAGTLSGPSGVCQGSGITLVASLPGGTWTASNSNATIVAPGIILGVTVGIDTIFYVRTNMCGIASVSKIISVNPVPVVLPSSGPSNHCVGTTITLTNPTPGGSWTSSNMSIATVGLSTGVVTGVAAGIVNITYTVTNAFGCPGSVLSPDTVNAVPVIPAIVGSSNICVGSVVLMTNTTSGGTWSSSNTAVASIDASGNVTGVASGTAIISYSVVNICGSNVVTKTVTVNSLPTVAAITGASTVCVGANITLADATSGGVWSSSDLTVATVGSSSGVVTGVAAGTSIILYTVTNAAGCSASSSTFITVNPLPAVAPITGPTSVCIGGSATLSNATAGGIWTSGTPSIATIGSTTGIVNGIAVGTTMISYSFTDVNGCTNSVMQADTVVALPTVAAIAGPVNACVGATVTLTNATTGGTWSSSNPSVAVIDMTTGALTGMTPGTTTITYTFTSAIGCTSFVTRVETVNPLPAVAAITGTMSVCVGGTSTLADATTGGTWSSGDVTLATVGSSTGVVTGVAAGFVNITYTYTNSIGCSNTATAVVSVNALPVVAAITGVTNQCIGGTTTLADATPGGTWSSSTTTVATIDASGVVTGVAVGVTTITYFVTDAFGCTGMATASDTTNTVPTASPITGSLNACLGANTTLSNAVAGGAWSSSNISVATIGATTGIVTGVSLGTATISYVVTNSCGSVTNTAVVTVNPLPSAGTISSVVSVICAGTSSTLSSTVTGGTWSSSNVSIATVGSSSGVVTGVATGTATITYTVTSSTGCSAFTTFVVNIGPALPTMAVLPVGSATICNGVPVYMYVNPPTSGLTYQWMINGNPIAGATNAGYTTDTAGSYSVIVDNGTCSVVLTGTTVVYQPNAVVSFNPPNILFTGSYSSYQWYLNGVPIPGATTSIVNIIGAGNYTVKVSDVNGCSDSSDAYHVGGVSAPNVAYVNEINIYPNPATSMLSIEAAVKVNVSLRTIDGKEVLKLNDARTIDISKLTNGLYMLMIYDETGQLLKTAKFTKVE